MIVDSLLLSIGVDAKEALQGFRGLQNAATEFDEKFEGLSQKWVGVFRGIASQIAAPVAGAFAVSKVISSYMSDISEVATMTGAYSQKLEEWRIKRAMLNRVTREDIELYKKGREAIVGFRIAMADLSAKIMREAMPVMKFLIDGLNKFSAWCDRNGDNIIRFLKVTAAVLTTLFLPAFIKMGAAMLASPITWIVAAIAALVLVIDDLVVYMQGGKSALDGFWSMFGTGAELSEKVSAALAAVKTALSVLAKPLAIIAAGFAAFKVAHTLLNGFIRALMMVHKAMLLVAANPLMVVLTALGGLIYWIIDAFNRAGGDWSKVIGIMGQDLIDFLNIFGGLGDSLLGFIGSAMPLIESIGDVLSGVLQFVVNGAKLLFNIFTGGSAEARDALIENLGNAVTQILGGLAGIVVNLVETIGNGLKQLFDFAVYHITNGVKALAQTIVYGLTLAWETVSSFVIGIWDGIVAFVAGALGGIADSVSASLRSVIDFFAGLFDSVVGYFTDIGRSISDACSAVYDAVASVFGGIGTAISDALSAAVDAVGAAFSAIGDGIKAYYQGLFGFFTSIIDGIVGLFSDLPDGAGAAFNEVIDRIAAALESAWGVVTDVVDAVLGVFKDLATELYETLAGVFSDIADAVSPVVDAVLSFYSTVLSNARAVFTKLLDFVSGIWDSIVNGVSSMVNSVVGLVSGLWDAISSGAAGMVEAVVGFVSSLFESISTVFSQIVGIVTGAFDSALQAAVDFFTSIFDFLAQIPQKIMEAFDISGAIKGAVDSIKDTVGGAVDSVADFLGFGSDDEQSNNASAGGNGTEPRAGARANANSNGREFTTPTNTQGAAAAQTASTQNAASTAQNQQVLPTSIQSPEMGANASTGVNAAFNPATGDVTKVAPQDNGFAQMQAALQQQALMQQQMPVNANTNSYTTNNNQSTNTQNNASEINNNIVINAGGNPRDVRNAVSQGLNDAGMGGGSQLVSTSDGGTMSI